MVLFFFRERILQRDILKQTQNLLEAQYMQREQRSSLFKTKQKYTGKSVGVHPNEEHPREVI